MRRNKNYFLRRMMQVTKGLCIICLFSSIAWAQESKNKADLEKCVVEAKETDVLFSCFQSLTHLYLAEHQYNEYVQWLKSLGKQKQELEAPASCYIALSRYYQLKYLEASQDWNEYFDKGNLYRSEIEQSVQLVIDKTTVLNPMHILSRLILWKMNKDQDNAASEEALLNLMQETLEFVKDGKEISLIKHVGDELLAYGEKVKSRQLYKAYVKRLISAQVKSEELKETASRFYEEENIELAETIYDAYIAQVAQSLTKEELLSVLKSTALQFSYKSPGHKDLLYAEEIFKKIEELFGNEVFDEELLYIRALNLEKLKECLRAKEYYSLLVSRYPKSGYADEANFKIGLISVYVSRDIKTAKIYFEKLAQQESVTAYCIGSLYQLGLLSQWEGEAEKAKLWYATLKNKAKDGFGETVAQVKERLEEIEDAKPIAYNLKTFLDLSLKEENTSFTMVKVDLRASPQTAKKEEAIKISSSSYLGETGCMQVDLEFLWSGDTGQTAPSSQQPSFQTQYKDPGTKVIFLVAVSPSGIVDRAIDLVDIY